MNKLQVLINGIDYSKKTTYPFKWADLLDEQLDEASLFLKNIKRKEPFAPLTEIELTITNTPESKVLGIKNTNNTAISQFYDTETKRLTQSITKTFLVALDTTFNYPVGSEFYTHELYLIEQTKLLEGYIGESICFTNPLGNDYMSTSGDALFFYGNIKDWNSVNEEALTNVFYSSFLKNPSGIGEFTLPSLQDFVADAKYSRQKPSRIVQVVNDIGQNLYKCEAEIVDYPERVRITETIGDNSPNIVWEGQSIEDFDNDVEINGVSPSDFVVVSADKTIQIENTGIFTIKYQFMPINADGTDGGSVAYVGNISFVINRLPLKKWTITSVINRLFDLIVPLKTTATETTINNVKELSGISTELPLFVLNGVNDYNDDGSVNNYTYTEGSTAWKLDKILAPEFVFTKMNLREQLKQVGGFIHGEPRIVGKNERNQYIIDFDWYGKEEYASISDKKCISEKLTYDINNFATSLDSETDNLVSQMSWAQGVIFEPWQTGSKSLRTEITTARLEEEDGGMIISTEYPIYSIGENAKLICTFIPDFGNNQNKGWDITPYIFESADYKNLSPYDLEFPYSRASALYYTQGEKNIKGLFFKRPNANPVKPLIEKYSIVNILRLATGNRNLVIKAEDYPKLTFRVSYVPIFSARVRTNKSLILSRKPFTLAYNQSANIIESGYFGENLKGAIARLGNVEKQKTYKVAFLSDIPKTGQKIKESDGDYSISAVSVEMETFYFKVTLGLTKNFNRISEYVGINSEKRMWEVSEKSAYLRSRVLPEYILISKTNHINSQNSRFFKTQNLLRILLNKPTSPPTENGELKGFNYGVVDSVLCTQFSKTGQQVGKDICLPVVSVAFGNSMLFTFKVEDNYSAGQRTIQIESENDVSGTWSDYVPYCDYYGRYYWWKVQYFYEGISRLNLPTSLPEVPKDIKISTERIIASSLTAYRKDNREVPTEAYELSLVTDNADIIIGSALAGNCKLVNKNPVNIRCVGLSQKINILDKKIDQSLITEELTYLIEVSETVGAVGYRNALVVSEPKNANTVAWAIITETSSVDINVEDEDGVESTQTIERGGELVLGQNLNGSTGTQTLYFSIKDKVYEF